MLEKAIALARKLKTLAERGIDGEKQNASEMLERLMKERGITFDMIEGIEKAEHEFFIEEKQKKFFYQIVSSVLGSDTNVHYFKVDRKIKRSRFVTCTAAEAIEIQAKFDFFWSAWEKDLGIFYSAFIQKNHIYAKPRENEDDDDKELSDEEMKRLLRVSQMMDALDKHKFYKQLNR